MGGSPGGGGVVPPNSAKIFASKYLLISKNTGTVNLVEQKIVFGGVPEGGGWHPQIMSIYLSVKYLLISKKLAP